MVPFEIEGIRSGNTTRGHRFMGAQHIEVRRFEDYAQKLAREFVIVDAHTRIETIRAEARNLAFAQGLELIEDEALLKADFMPHLLIQPYFALEQYWDGEEFRMDTLDGRSILISLGGPEFLPSAWVAEAQGVPFKEIRWEYRRVGTVSAANFQLPEGLSPLE